MAERTETMKHCLSWMEWLDRWGYITAGFSLLILGMLIFAQSWYKFITTAASKSAVLPAGLQVHDTGRLEQPLLEVVQQVDAAGLEHGARLLGDELAGLGDASGAGQLEGVHVSSSALRPARPAPGRG